MSENTPVLPFKGWTDCETDSIFMTEIFGERRQFSMDDCIIVPAHQMDVIDVVNDELAAWEMDRRFALIDADWDQGMYLPVQVSLHEGDEGTVIGCEI